MIILDAESKTVSTICFIAASIEQYIQIDFLNIK